MYGDDWLVTIPKSCIKYKHILNTCCTSSKASGQAHLHSDYKIQMEKQDTVVTLAIPSFTVLFTVSKGKHYL